MNRFARQAIAGRRVPEKDVQRDVVQLYERFGCFVYSFSQPRASMQTPGIPDLYVFSLRAKEMWWHETKAADGKMSEAQIDFAARCQVAGVGHLVGGLEAAKQKLEQLGLVRKVG